MEGRDGRKDGRIAPETPEFIRAELKIGKDSGDEKVYDLRVLNYSTTGLGMVVGPKDFDIFKIVKKGVILRDVAFFSRMSMLKVDGTVKHITKIDEGKYKGCYLLGIESSDIIDV